MHSDVLKNKIDIHLCLIAYVDAWLTQTAGLIEARIKLAYI